MTETDDRALGRTLSFSAHRSRTLALMVIAAVAASAGVVQAFQMRPPASMALTSAPLTP